MPFFFIVYIELKKLDLQAIALIMSFYITAAGRFRIVGH